MPYHLVDLAPQRQLHKTDIDDSTTVKGVPCTRKLSERRVSRQAEAINLPKTANHQASSRISPPEPREVAQQRLATLELGCTIEELRSSGDTCSGVMMIRNAGALVLS